MGRFGVSVFLLLLITTGLMAQQLPDKFLSKVFAINSFKINSSLKDIQNDKQLADNLSFFMRADNRAVFDLAGQAINLPGLKPLDRLAFDTVELTFENDKLHHIDLYIPSPFNNAIFKKTFDQFNTEYGQAVTIEKKNSHYKEYVWHLGTNELMLSPLSGATLIRYGSNVSIKKTGWIYVDRKGKGNGTMQFNLPYFQKLIGEKLTIASFEKILPQWQTTGALNHLIYDLDFNNLSPSRPVFFITYSLSNYSLRVETIDTTTKVINEITLNNIKDPNVFLQFEKDLVSLNYIKKPKLKYVDHVDYTNHKFSVLLDKENSRISVMNEFKLNLP